MKRFYLLFAALLFSGCGMFPSDVVIHPIEKADIFKVNKGSVITTPDGTKIEVVKSGWFLSVFYVKEVMQAKIRAKKK